MLAFILVIVFFPPVENPNSFEVPWTLILHCWSPLLRLKLPLTSKRLCKACELTLLYFYTLFLLLETFPHFPFFKMHLLFYFENLFLSLFLCKISHSLLCAPITLSPRHFCRACAILLLLTINDVSPSPQAVTSSGAGTVLSMTWPCTC